MPFKPPTYSYVCPGCGGPLQPLALDAQTAPWLCDVCHFGFWATDLGVAARKQWHGQGFTHGADSAQMHSDRMAEFAVAVTNGTSLREDQIGIASVSVLQSAMASASITPAFKALVQTQLTNMGA
jgi:hypothetical protein